MAVDKQCLQDIEDEQGWAITGLEQGQRERLDPTNKNYAPELSTFGIIIEVSHSGVQWSSLSLEKPPSWSWLISAPGKYEFRVSNLIFYTQST